MATKVNVYADVPDHSAVIEGNPTEVSDEVAVIGNLNRILAAVDPTGLARAEMMYGTDWLMLSRSSGTGAYYPNMKTKFSRGPGLIGQKIRGFVGGNAAKFLSLVPSDARTGPRKTRQRLESFYKANNLNSSVLANWD